VCCGPPVAAAQELTGEGKRNLLVQQRNFTVTYHLFNRGNATAYNVRLTDEWPADTFTVVSGSSLATWAQIAP
jgi:uncharacterized repeat protein (TIGR01451 family)